MSSPSMIFLPSKHSPLESTLECTNQKNNLLEFSRLDESGILSYCYVCVLMELQEQFKNKKFTKLNDNVELKRATFEPICTFFPPHLTKKNVNL
jgi:hypothetical protein